MAEVRVGEHSVAEVRLAEIRAIKVHMGEIGVGELRLTEFGAGEVRAPKIDWLPVLSSVSASDDSQGGLDIGA